MHSVAGWGETKRERSEWKKRKERVTSQVKLHFTYSRILHGHWIFHRCFPPSKFYFCVRHRSRHCPVLFIWFCQPPCPFTASSSSGCVLSWLASWFLFRQYLFLCVCMFVLQSSLCCFCCYLAVACVVDCWPFLYYRHPANVSATQKCRYTFSESLQMRRLFVQSERASICVCVVLHTHASMHRSLRFSIKFVLVQTNFGIWIILPRKRYLYFFIFILLSIKHQFLIVCITICGAEHNLCVCCTLLWMRSRFYRLRTVCFFSSSSSLSMCASVHVSYSWHSIFHMFTFLEYCCCCWCHSSHRIGTG